VCVCVCKRVAVCCLVCKCERMCACMCECVRLHQIPNLQTHQRPRHPHTNKHSQCIETMHQPVPHARVLLRLRQSRCSVSICANEPGRRPALASHEGGALAIGTVSMQLRWRATKAARRKVYICANEPRRRPALASHEGGVLAIGTVSIQLCWRATKAARRKVTVSAPWATHSVRLCDTVARHCSALRVATARPVLPHGPCCKQSQSRTCSIKYVEGCKH